MGGLFVEASDPSPPLSGGPDSAVGTKHQQHAGLQPFKNEAELRVLFSETKNHSPYLEKRLRRKDNGMEEKVDSIDPVATMSDKEEEAFEHRERLTKGQKAKRHCLRWWIFVGIPNIAQSRVNSATLTIQGMTVTQMQADNFTMAINSTLRVDSSISAVIDAFDGNMYLEDWPPQTPFLRIAFPQVTSASETAVNITQFTEILDHHAFDVFNTWLLANESVNVSVEGDTHIRVSGVSKKFPVHFKKIIETPGLGNLNGTTVPESKISLTSDAQGDNFFGTVSIPNRSFLSFELGNASFINYMLGEVVGTVYVDNMSLARGLNNLSMRANISQAPVLEAIQQPPYCETGVLPFQLQGLNVTNHGQYLSYYSLALGSINQSISIDVGTDLSALGVDVKCSDTTSLKRSMVS